MNTFNEVEVATAMRRILEATGSDATREGLKDTPERYARFLRDWVTPEPFKFTTFDAEGASEMIVQSAIPFYSLCEHHLLPFHGTAAVGYIPKGRIVGLSKLARAVQACARGFQNQERITTRVARMLEDELQPEGVGVIIRAEHLCMSMRGVRAAGTMTTTQALRGVFLDGFVRAEFMTLAEGK